ncbi:MAG: PRTRC system protein C [Chloroflexota bacterium]
MSEEIKETTQVEGGEKLPRVFVYNEKEFADPLPGEPIEAIMSMLAGVFPELANGEHTSETKDGQLVVRFRKKAAVNG